MVKMRRNIFPRKKFYTRPTYPGNNLTRARLGYGVICWRDKVGAFLITRVPAIQQTTLILLDTNDSNDSESANRSFQIKEFLPGPVFWEGVYAEEFKSII